MEVLTAANQLTILRVLLVPVFALCMLYDLPGWALLTFLIAGATDLLDGWIARHTGPTTLGAWLDPAADKLLLTTMFVMLTVPGPGVVRLPLWLTVGVTFHLALALTLRLGIFPFGVLALYPVFFHPDDLLSFARAGRRRGRGDRRAGGSPAAGATS